MSRSCFCKLFTMYAAQKVFLFFFGFVAVAICANNSFENLDIDKLLGNEEQRKAAFACLMDQKPCGQMQGLKDTIPGLIKTKCSACTPKQKEKYDHVSKVLLEKHPDIFNALVLKYSEKAN